MDGNSFDEVPGLYHWQKYNYLQATSDAVRGSEQLGDKLVGAFDPFHLSI